MLLAAGRGARFGGAKLLAPLPAASQMARAAIGVAACRASAPALDDVVSPSCGPATPSCAMRSRATGARRRGAARRRRDGREPRCGVAAARTPTAGSSRSGTCRGSRARRSRASSQAMRERRRDRGAGVSRRARASGGLRGRVSRRAVALTRRRGRAHGRWRTPAGAEAGRGRRSGRRARRRPARGPALIAPSVRTAPLSLRAARGRAAAPRAVLQRLVMRHQARSSAPRADGRSGSPAPPRSRAPQEVELRGVSTPRRCSAIRASATAR